MFQTGRYFAVITLSLAALLAGACAGESPAPIPTPTPQISPESQKVAEEFVRNDPTFVFDGMPETLKLIGAQTRQSQTELVYIFEFQSRHAGYDDRTGQVLAQVITPHQAVITVQEGQVISAVMDGKWDMLTQKMF